MSKFRGLYTCLHTYSTATAQSLFMYHQNINTVLSLEWTIFSNMHFVNHYWYFTSMLTHTVHNPPPPKILNI